MSDNNKNYIDNEEFLNEIIEWRKKYFTTLAETGEEIKISDSIAVKLMMICNRITYRPNFRNYSYREEMAEDALENVIRYFKTYDPEKTKNPFSYFSSAAYWSCVSRINKEKDEFAVKAKYIQGMAFDDIPMADTQYHDSASTDDLGTMKDYLGSYYSFDLEQYENSKNKKKAKK